MYKLLMDYVRAKAERIIAERESLGRFPAPCSMYDILANIREDITECMRELHRKGEYRASATVNKTPMLLRRNKIKRDGS